jgi:hypothetical protein
LSIASSTSSAPDERGVLGNTQPRIWTPPLRDLTPDTSYGFDLIDFAAEVCRTPFDPWEEWLSIHAGELLPDGRPRFRILLVLVARQNGKTTWAKVLIKYWLFIDLAALVLGTGSDRSYAKKTWQDVCTEVSGNPDLRAELADIRLTVSEESLVTTAGGEYIFAANNRRAARSRTLHKWLCDEVREHLNMDCWDAASNAMNAVPDGQIVAISNQGDDQSVLLHALREPAAAFIETGQGDPRLGLIEWSAPPGADPTDLHALAQANPNLGRRVDRDALLGAARRAKAAGGLELASFRTEVMCQRVARLNPAIDPGGWSNCLDPGGLDDVRDRIAMLVDVAPDLTHATLYAAAQLDDDRVRVDFVRDWAGGNCVDVARRDLPDILAQTKPRMFGWLPGGPAATMAPDMGKRTSSTKRTIRPSWVPRGTKVVEVTTDLPAVCMGFAEQVQAGRIAHSGDPLLDAQVAAAEPLRRGDAWVFSRRGDGHVDAVYAAAGAVWLARTMPPRRRAVVLVPRVQ